jgi:hypothetical protein
MNIASNAGGAQGHHNPIAGRNLLMFIKFVLLVLALGMLAATRAHTRVGASPLTMGGFCKRAPLGARLKVPNEGRNFRSFRPLGERLLTLF